MTIYAEPRFLPAGDCAVSVELGDEISREANGRVLTLERLLAEAGIPGVVETLPTFRSLLVHYDPLALYDPAASDPILLRPGDRVRFRPIDAAEFHAIAEAVAAGTYRPRIVPDRIGAAA